jgi:hypothetical protein
LAAKGCLALENITGIEADLHQNDPESISESCVEV